MANITGHQGSYQYITDQYDLLNLTAGTFSFILPVNYSMLQRPFMISLSVENPLGFSPFSSEVLIRGAENSMYWKWYFAD